MREIKNKINTIIIIFCLLINIFTLSQLIINKTIYNNLEVFKLAFRLEREIRQNNILVDYILRNNMLTYSQILGLIN